MQNRQCRLAPEDKDRDLKSFGGVTTCDHIVTFGSENICHEGYQNAVVMKDLNTGWLECYPVALKSGLEARMALLHFVGDREEVKLFYSDNAPPPSL